MTATLAGPPEDHEEVGNAGALQERAEDDEEDDVGVADAHRGADDAAGGIKQLIDNVFQGLIEAGVPAELVVEGVNQQGAQYAQDGQAHAPAAQLDEYQDADGADDDMDGLQLRGQLDDGEGVDGKVEEAACTQHHQDPVIPRHMVDPGIPLLGGVHQIADDNDETQEQGQPPLRQGLAEQGHQDAVHGEARHQCPQHRFGNPLPHPGVGLPVILFHHGVHIRLDVVLHAVFLVHEVLFHFHDGVFLLFEQAHSVSSLIVFPHPQLTGAGASVLLNQGLG